MKYCWRIDLSKTEKFWEGWFRGLSSSFLAVPVPKMLMLAGLIYNFFHNQFEGMLCILTISSMFSLFPSALWLYHFINLGCFQGNIITLSFLNSFVVTLITKKHVSFAVLEWTAVKKPIQKSSSIIKTFQFLLSLYNYTYTTNHLFAIACYHALWKITAVFMWAVLSTFLLTIIMVGLLLGVDRLDRELSIGQMQGKFQMQVGRCIEVFTLNKTLHLTYKMLIIDHGKKWTCFTRRYSG